MSRIVTVYSFRRGTGKTTVAANLAALAARDGQRVALVDANFQAPSAHLLLGQKGSEPRSTLNDYLWGTCELEELPLDCSGLLGEEASGALFLVPASDDLAEIARLLRGGYYVNLLHDLFHELATTLSLDLLVIDTAAGLNDETMVALAAADSLLVILRPDEQDYHGTGTMIGVARELEIPEIRLLVNNMPRSYDPAEIEAELLRAYDCPVGAILPCSDEVIALGSGALFALERPEHEISQRLHQVLEG